MMSSSTIHPAPRPGSQVAIVPVRQVEVGPVDAIPLGQGRAYVVGDRTVAVFRQRDGRLFATDNECPHRGGPLADGMIGDGTVICPLHGWKIDLETGRCVSESAGVRVYHVTLLGGRMLLSFPERSPCGSMVRI